MATNLLTASVASCPGTITYAWTKNGVPVGTSSTLVPTGPGIYAVTVNCDSSPNCTDTTNITLTCDFMNLNITQTTGDITANHSGCSSPTITWTGPGGFTATGATIVPGNGNGAYTATIVCGNLNSQQGCTETATFNCNFTTEIVNTAGTLSTINTPVSPFSCATYSYLWTSPTGGLSSGPTVVANANGTWTVAVSCVANGCIASDTIVVAQNCESFVPTVTGTVGDLTVSGGACTAVTVSWVGPGGFTSTANPVVPNNGNGTYTGTVTCDDNGLDDSCVGTVTHICNMFTTIAQQISGDLIANVSSSNCSGFTYAWTGPGGFTGNTQIITPTTTGMYNVTVTCTNTGCIATDDFDYIACTSFAVTITANQATNTLTANPTGCGGTTTYLWSTGAITQTINPSLADGTTTYTVTATCGTCTDTDSHTISRDTIYYLLRVSPSTMLLESLIINASDVVTSNQTIITSGSNLTFPTIEGFIQSALGSNGYQSVVVAKNTGNFMIRINGALISGFGTSNTFGDALLTATASPAWTATTLTIDYAESIGNPTRTFTASGITTTATSKIASIGVSLLGTLPISNGAFPLLDFSSNGVYDITNNGTDRTNLQTLLNTWLSSNGYTGSAAVTTNSITVSGTNATFVSIRQAGGVELPSIYYDFS